jgi:hypothetical protein
MKRERQAILSLIALGRITPAEAERLLAAWNAGREEIWALAACLVICLAQFLPALARLAHTLLPERISGLHHAITAVSYWMGGLL